MSTISEQQAQVSAEKTRAVVLPIIAAVILFAAIIFIQFSDMLGANTFPASLVLAIGFYFCYAWHGRLTQRANVRAETLKKG
jgi:predicted membrane protein